MSKKNTTWSRTEDQGTDGDSQPWESSHPRHQSPKGRGDEQRGANARRTATKDKGIFWRCQRTSTKYTAEATKAREPLTDICKAIDSDAEARDHARKEGQCLNDKLWNRSQSNETKGENFRRRTFERLGRSARRGRGELLVKRERRGPNLDLHVQA